MEVLKNRQEIVQKAAYFKWLENKHKSSEEIWDEVEEEIKLKIIITKKPRKSKEYMMIKSVSLKEINQNNNFVINDETYHIIDFKLSVDYCVAEKI